MNSNARPQRFFRQLSRGALAGFSAACLPLTARAAEPAPASAPTPAPAAARATITTQASDAGFNPGRIQPKYPTPYAPASVPEITAVLDRVRTYLETASPVRVIDRATGQPVADLTKLPERVSLERGDFQIVSYEWGVTYAGMLLAAETTGDARYREFTAKRLEAVALVAAHVRANSAANPMPALPPPAGGPAGGAGAGTDTTPNATARGVGEPGGGQGNFFLRSVVAPRSLDDSGSMCAAMIKAHRAGIGGDLRPWIDNYMKWISTGQMRLGDDTLARNRPLPNSLWLDDLFMSIPALAQMGKLTGDRAYYDDAVKQATQFAGRMFVKEKNLYMHGWVEGMEVHPAFHWARANGWAIMANIELLEVLPEEHPGRAKILELLRSHAHGLAATQGSGGLWHQLLDRHDSYEETSATAIYVYCIARAINRGWLDALAYGPMVSLGWNAVVQQVNAQGQVENTCVGTGMGWEPMFYYFRPVSVYAAHGYGPVLLAGAEMITLRKGKGAVADVHDGGVHFGRALPAF